MSRDCAWVVVMLCSCRPTTSIGVSLCALCILLKVASAAFVIPFMFLLITRGPGLGSMPSSVVSLIHVVGLGLLGSWVFGGCQSGPWLGVLGWGCWGWVVGRGSLGVCVVVLYGSFVGLFWFAFRV